MSNKNASTSNSPTCSIHQPRKRLSATTGANVRISGRNRAEKTPPAAQDRSNQCVACLKVRQLRWQGRCVAYRDTQKKLFFVTNTMGYRLPLPPLTGSKNFNDTGRVCWSVRRLTHNKPLACRLRIGDVGGKCVDRQRHVSNTATDRPDIIPYFHRFYEFSGPGEFLHAIFRV